MKNKVYKFNELRDIKKVVSHLAIDVNDMLRTGIVDSGATSEEGNGIEDPNQIIGMVRDNFDAVDCLRAIKKYGKKAPAKAAAVVEQAAAAPSAPSETN